MVENLTFQLGERSYPISFGATLVEEVHGVVRALQSAGRKVVVVTDANVASAQADFLSSALSDCPRLVVAAGEGTKSLTVFGTVLDFLAAEKWIEAGC